MQLTDWVGIMSLVVGGGFFLWPSTHSTKNLWVVSVCIRHPMGIIGVSSHTAWLLGSTSA